MSEVGMRAAQALHECERFLTPEGIRKFHQGEHLGLDDFKPEYQATVQGVAIGDSIWRVLLHKHY